MTPDLTDRLAGLWWHQVPSAVARVSRTARLALTDGIYLVAWQPIAAWLPPVTSLAGIVCAALRLGDAVFTQSLVVVSLAAGIGFLSVQAGLWFALSYAVTDFAIQSGDLRWEGQLGLLMTYVSLFLVAVFVPAMVQFLRASTPLPSPRTLDLRLLVDLVLTCLIGAALLYLILQIVPVLIRPRFEWAGGFLPVSAFAPIQDHEWVPLVAAGGLLVFRVLAEYSSAAIDPYAPSGYTNDVDYPGLVDCLPATVRTLLAAAATTAVLAGALRTWGDAWILFGGVAFLGLVRVHVVSRVRAWRRVMAVIPPVIRLGAVLAIGFGITWVVLRAMGIGSSFRPLIVATLTALVPGVLAFPERTSPRLEATHGGA